MHALLHYKETLLKGGSNFVFYSLTGHVCAEKAFNIKFDTFDKYTNTRLGTVTVVM